VIGNSIGGSIQRPLSLDKHPHTLPRTDFVDQRKELNPLQTRATPANMMAQTFTGKFFQGFSSRKHSDATPTANALTPHNQRNADLQAIVNQQNPADEAQN
jgi:hypothetical protein